MPYRQCNHPGCSELIITASYCDKHKKLNNRQYNQERPEYHKLYNTKRWRQLRKIVLRNNPLCVECFKLNKIVPASIVDHIVPHDGNNMLFWDYSNLQPLCVSCHNSKTCKANNKKYK